MDDLFQREWYGRYWLKLILNEPLIFIAIAAVVILAFLIMKGPRR